MEIKKGTQLETLNLQDLEMVRKWRNELKGILRTSFLINEEMQKDFYYKNLSNRISNVRYFKLIKDSLFAGMVGITDIEWENRLGQISIIVNPNMQGLGIGYEALEMLFNEAFMHMNLNCLYAEVYKSNENMIFWDKVCLKYNPRKSILEDRKYFEGKYYDSIYLSFTKKRYSKG